MTNSATFDSNHIRSDVAIVGYGPTGMVLAALLGQKGMSVTVLERYESLYSKPRAAAFDDETMRTFQQLGVAEKVLAGTNVQNGYVWVNGKGQVLTDFEYDNPGPNGWPAQYMMYQPHLEQVLDEAVRSIPDVQVFPGAAVTAIEDLGESVSLTALTTTDQQITVEANFVVGADGGNSFVRQALGIDLDSYDFSENWLVCDFKLHHDVAGLPTFQQVCNPDEPIAIVNIGPGHHRFSFRLERDADREAIVDPDKVLGPVSATTSRQTTLTSSGWPTTPSSQPLPSSGDADVSCWLVMRRTRCPPSSPREWSRVSGMPATWHGRSRQCWAEHRRVFSIPSRKNESPMSVSSPRRRLNWAGSRPCATRFRQKNATAP